MTPCTGCLLNKMGSVHANSGYVVAAQDFSEGENRWSTWAEYVWPMLRRAKDCSCHPTLLLANLPCQSSQLIRCCKVKHPQTNHVSCCICAHLRRYATPTSPISISRHRCVSSGKNSGLRVESLNKGRSLV